MVVKKLRQLIEKLQPKLGNSMFGSALLNEFPSLLDRLIDEDRLPLYFFQTKSDSIFLLNMYGILVSMQKSCETLGDKELLQELKRIIKEVKLEFPFIRTAANPIDIHQDSKITLT